MCSRFPPPIPSLSFSSNSVRRNPMAANGLLVERHTVGIRKRQYRRITKQVHGNDLIRHSHASDYSSSVGFPSVHDAPVEFTVPNGTLGSISGYLQMHTDAKANGAPPTTSTSSISSVDAATTNLGYGAYFWFEPVTPDSVVDSASGHDHLAVPEPGASASMAGAFSLCGVLLCRCHRRTA